MKTKGFRVNSFIKECLSSLKKPKKKIWPLIIAASYGPSCIGKTTVMKIFKKV